MREYFNWSVRASVRNSVVLPRPGTPSSRTCPAERRQMSTPSTTSSWPTIILAISRRTAFNRSTACWRVASDPTFTIVEDAEAADVGAFKKVYSPPMRGHAEKTRERRSLRFDLHAHFAYQDAEHGSHLGECFAGLLGGHRAGEARPEAHDPVVEDEQPILDG